MNLYHSQTENELYIKDLDTGRFAWVYLDAPFSEGKYCVVDDTGLVRSVDTAQEAGNIVMNFFQRDESGELSELMRELGYEIIGWAKVEVL